MVLIQKWYFQVRIHSLDHQQVQHHQECGMILQLTVQGVDNNNIGCQCFDVSWLSDYSWEQEKLFITHNWLQFKSIIIKKTNKNYEKYCYEINIIDSMSISWFGYLGSVNEKQYCV